MANLITNMMNYAGQAIGNWISPYIGGMNQMHEMPKEDLAYRYAVLRNYYNGDHRPQLHTKAGAQNENITQNWCGLAADRSIARMFRGGIQFNLPDGADAQQEYISKTWDINKKEILLYQYALHGTVYGTPYFKICPDEMRDPYTGDIYPRLIAIDPEIIRVHTSHDDMSEVYAYVISYSHGKKMHWEITYRSDMTYGFDSNGNVMIMYAKKDDEVYEAETTWVIDEIEQEGGGARQVTSTTPWLYNFPPIIHQKNLPSLKSCYGDSDFDDVVNIQDKSNFVVSNTNKIVKFFANPLTFIFGTSLAQLKDNKLDGAVGSIYAIPNVDAKAMNLEMSSDLASSRNLSQDLKKSIFDIAREVDTDSIGDKLGTLTNFGLRVLYTDATDKNDVKRQLYGDAIKELNRRLLVLNNFAPEASDPGKITWGDALITNVLEDMQADQLAMDMGIIDLETITKRYQSRYGVDFETVQANIAKQKEDANKNTGDIGAMILRDFNNGKGVNMQPKQMTNQQEVMANANADRTIP